MRDALGQLVAHAARPLRGAVPAIKRMTSDGLGLLRRRFHRVLARHGCRTTDHFAGFQITGRFQTKELVELIGLLPEGSTEFMCHPGRCGEALRNARTRLKESRVHELEALIARETRDAIERGGIEMIGVERLELRRRLVRSFGSCSFDEPRDDLRALGLL